MARPKYKPTEKEKNAVYEMAKNGYTEYMMAESLGICQDTFTKYKHEFIGYIKKGREEKDIADIKEVRSALIRKCIGYEVEEIQKEGIATYDAKGNVIKDKNGNIKMDKVRIKIQKKYHHPSDTAIIFYLCNKDKDNYKSIQKIIEKANSKEFADEIKKLIEAIDKNNESKVKNIEEIRKAK